MPSHTNICFVLLMDVNIVCLYAIYSQLFSTTLLSWTNYSIVAILADASKSLVGTWAAIYITVRKRFFI